MIEINSAEDIKLIKEFARAFASDIDVEKISNDIINSNSIKKLETKNSELEAKIDALTKVQIQSLEQLNAILSFLEQQKTQIPKEVEPVKKESKRKYTTTTRDNLPFEPYAAESKEYQEIILEESQLIHVFQANSKNGFIKHILPIDLFELLVITEAFLKGERSIQNKEVKRYCDLFGISKKQFSKVYYNLMIGKFDDILSQIDKMISDSVFSKKKSHIYINDHDTNIDEQNFNELLSIYMNDDDRCLTIYRLIKENPDINPYDLLITLKKSGYAAKVFE